MEVFSMILSLLSGVAMFLYGMLLMGDGLKMVAGDKLEAFLYKMTNTPLKGVALGAGVTCVIQSSSATTVMVIGFVNSMMMKLRQAISIIMGGEYRNKHYRMDFVSVVHRGIRRFGNDSVHCHYYGTGCSDRHHSQDVLQTISL